MLGKNGAFTFVALLTLALGNWCEYCHLQRRTRLCFVRFRIRLRSSWSVFGPGDLKRLGSQYPAAMPTFRDWQQQAHSFNGLAAYASNRFHVAGNEGPEEIRGLFATSNFFDVME